MITVKTKNNFICFCTCKNVTEAKKIATVIVRERLAACVNMIKGVSSIYSWNGKICNDSEVLLIIKGCSGNRESLAKKIKSLHSYDVPEIIFAAIDSGSKDYLNWLSKNSI